MSHPVCLWSPKCVALLPCDLGLCVRISLAVLHRPLHELLSLCLSSGKRQIRSNVFQEECFRFFEWLVGV